MTNLPPLPHGLDRRVAQGTFVLATKDCMTRRQALQAMGAWGFPGGSPEPGASMSQEQAERRIDSWFEPTQPPEFTCWPPPPADLSAKASTNPGMVAFCHPTGEWGSSPPRMDWTIRYKQFHYIQFPWPGGRPRPDASRQGHSDWFLEAVRRLMPIFEPSFAFGGHDRDLELPIRDPRYRAWGVNYYGPKLVKEIGEDLLMNAPAWKVEADLSGGVWVQLDELPFVNSPQLEARRDAVWHHLGLAERFPYEY